MITVVKLTELTEERQEYLEDEAREWEEYFADKHDQILEEIYVKQDERPDDEYMNDEEMQRLQELLEAEAEAERIMSQMEEENLKDIEALIVGGKK